LTQLAAPANENREADLVLRVRQQHAPRDLPRAPGDAATRHALGLSRGLPPPLQHPDRAGRTGGRERGARGGNPYLRRPVPADARGLRAARPDGGGPSRNLPADGGGGRGG